MKATTPCSATPPVGPANTLARFVDGRLADNRIATFADYVAWIHTNAARFVRAA